MEAERITNQNFRKDRKKNVNTLFVPVEEYNKVVADMEKVFPVSGLTFDGKVDLSRNHSIYDSYDVETNLAISVETYPAPMAGGYAELTLVGDGSHTPTFATNMTATPSSDDFDNTNGVVNKVGVYYDGSTFYYTITAFSE